MSYRQLDKLSTGLLAPVDIASLLIFRIGFGAIAAWWAIDCLRTGQITALFVVPQFHLRYWLFDWVRPWPEAGPYLHFIALAFLAACISVGLLYRWTTLLFAVGFSIFFLWDRTNYQNHYYLILLISWILVFLPLHRGWSLDAVNAPEISSAFIPRWMLWLIQFHIAMPYVFGGVAKLNSDWLAGAGLRDYLVTKSALPIVGPWLGSPSGAVTLAWGGLLFDLFVVPLLMWRRTRILAYLAAIVFHVSNHLLFSIHIFPWFMIVATTVFFEPDWPRRLFRASQLTVPSHEAHRWSDLSLRSRWGFLLLLIYLGAQVVLPFRHIVYVGDIGWHERGHYFAWRMMLRTKRSAMRIYITDPTLGETWNVDLLRQMHISQIEKCARDPEMVLDLAHLLRDDYRRRTGCVPEVRALVLTCYNGRKPQLLIDPTVDLAQEPRGFHNRPWIQPQSEPLPDVPWQRPMSEWQRVVRLPPLPTITRGPHGEKIATKP